MSVPPSHLIDRLHNFLRRCTEYEVSATSTRSFVTEDLSVECNNSPEHDAIIGWAVALVIIWPVGVCILYASLLFACRSSIARRSPSALVDATAFLHKDYNPEEFYYWELLELNRRLIITGWVTLIPNHLSSVRLLVALLVSIAMLTLTASAKPYERRADNTVAVSSQLCLVLIFVGAFVQQALDYVAELTGDERQAELVLHVVSAHQILVTFQIFAGVMLVLLCLHSLQGIVRSQRQPHIFLTSTNSRPVLSLSHGNHWHVFISQNGLTAHGTPGVIKLRLSSLLPEARVCLGREDAHHGHGTNSNEDLLQACTEVQSSNCVLMFMTKGYFASFDCKLDVRRAIEHGKPVVPVHEGDTVRGGATLESMWTECPRRVREFVFRSQSFAEEESVNTARFPAGEKRRVHRTPVGTSSDQLRHMLRPQTLTGVSLALHMAQRASGRTETCPRRTEPPPWTLTTKRGRPRILPS